jgi:ketosteroid isomerase-like protein
VTDDEIRKQTLEVVANFQTLIVQKRMDDWIDLWDEDGILEFPFAPAGRQPTYRGKAEVLAQMSASMDRVQIETVRYFEIHPLLEPTRVMVEAGTTARWLSDGGPYNQNYVLFLETRDGKIWRYREYSNSLTLLEAWGGLDKWRSQWGQPDRDNQARPYLTH